MYPRTSPMRGGTSMVHKRDHRQLYSRSLARVWRALSALALLAALLALPRPAQAAFSATLSGSVATLTGDIAGDTLLLGRDLTSPALEHNRASLDTGFFDNLDFDTTRPGSQ